MSAWNWSFGDGSISTEQNPEHTYTSDGSYTVNLTITEEGTGETFTASKPGYVKVYTAPVAGFREPSARPRRSTGLARNRGTAAWRDGIMTRIPILGGNQQTPAEQPGRRYLMKAMRVYKVLGALLGGGVLLQTTGCDPTALSSQQITGYALLFLDAALRALLGGAI